MVLPFPKARSGAGPSDAALVVAARAGEEWAQEALFRRHAPAIGGLLYRLLGRDDDLDDLLQDTFVHALGGLSSLREPQAFAGWLAGIAVGLTGKLLRRRKLLRRLGLGRSVDPMDFDAVIARNAPADDVAELREIYSIIERLPTNDRIALLLRRVEGHSLEEIAEMTGASLATVKRRIAAGDGALVQFRAEKSVK